MLAFSVDHFCPSSPAPRTQPMSHASVNRHSVLLIDLDNCPHEMLDLAESANVYDVIIASHGNREPRVPLGMASILGQLITSGQIEIWDMPGGKNSADFGLTFVAGRLAAEQPPGTLFEIASRDKDLDHAVALLKRCGHKARRIDSSKPKPIVRTEDHTSLSLDAAKLASSLSGKGANSRPAKRKTLISTSKARCSSAAAGMAALEELIAFDAIHYDAKGLPVYDGDKLKSLAGQAAALAKRKTEPLPVQKISATKPVVEDPQLRLF
ncbi:hypothetical protein SAMN06265222_114124 [Neorhodopirellula lusitana]|uniref:PIN-like domain-containing protein n=2 Tax=Neorhodopirellula lusitana TaxID=445327 RepID=A0ABY1QIH7_9BACT|nr:hypothetical protein SAMN06265222_114124 [Neorhodopirellula lusitana]